MVRKGKPRGTQGAKLSVGRSISSQVTRGLDNNGRITETIVGKPDKMVYQAGNEWHAPFI